MSRAFATSFLKVAESQKPEIFNTDQGVQFTAMAWTSRLESAVIRVSMDGVGRCFDNIFVERLWRSVKYEELYPKRYATVAEPEAGLDGVLRVLRWGSLASIVGESNADERA